MAIRAVDVTQTHSLTSSHDSSSPQTEFVCRTLTRSQRAEVYELYCRSNDLARAVLKKNEAGVEVIDHAANRELSDVLNRLWERLVVDVRCISAAVEHEVGPFGSCVPARLCDAWCINGSILMDVFDQAVKVNFATDEEKKTLPALSGSVTGSANTSAQAVKSAPGRPSDV